MNKTKKGLNLVELGIVVVIITVLLGIIGINGYNLYQNAIDTKIQENLRSLTDATQLFMVDTNGVRPCFSKDNKEGLATATGACANSGYDYAQGKTSKDLDFDGVEGEAFTFQNILAPSYIPSIPKEGRSGQKYFYTIGDPSTNQGTSSFAYTALLAGTKAEDKLDNNTSIINLFTADTESVLKGCNPSNVQFTKGEAYTQITASASGVLAESAKCDLYSDGLNVVKAAFTDNQQAKDQSVTVTVQ